MTITAYTDASHCPDRKFAVIGWLLRVGEKTLSHTLIEMSQVPTNGDAEMYATVRAMQDAFMINGVSKIIIVTDYRLNSVARHFKLMKKSKKSHIFFKEYKETIFMIEEWGIELHIRFEPRNTNPHSHKVDISCRKHLREIIKQNAGKTERRNVA